MNLVLKKLIVSVCLVAISYWAFSQRTFRDILKAADQCTEEKEYGSALTWLYKAQALKGVDTGYNESIYLYLGDNYEMLGRMDSATSCYLKAANYFESKKDISKLAFLYNSLGNIGTFSLDVNNQAIEYFRKELAYDKMLGDTNSILECLSSMGVVFRQLKMYDSALYCYNLALSSNLSSKQFKVKTIRRIADVYSLLKNYDKAMEGYNESIRQFEALNDTIELYNSYVNKGDCLVKQNQYKESLVCFKQAQQYITAAVTDDQIVALYHNFAEAYSHINNYEQAFKYRDMEADMNDSIKLQNIDKTAAETRANIEISRINDALTISEKDRKINNDRFLGALIGAVVICIIAFLSLRNATLRKKANVKLAAEKAKVEALADKLEEANQTKARLFSVISHDLRSPVSSLYASLKMHELKGGNEKDIDASSHIMHLLDTLEDLLTWSKSQMDRFTLQPVNLRINDVYADLIELNDDAAASKQITIENKAERSVKIYTDENLLKTILRNVLANSIHHAPNKSRVIADATMHESGVVCTISNEATATDAAMLHAKLQTADIGSSKHGLGNVLIKEFSEKLNAGFEVNYRDGQVHIQITVPNLKKNVTAVGQQEVVNV
jgi:tetratricopeptide (TPR) repeat protein